MPDEEFDPASAKNDQLVPWKQSGRVAIFRENIE
jgi:hypothetical protein